MADHAVYLLVQWEDRFMSVIQPKDVFSPQKKAHEYEEGDFVRAVYQKRQYSAVISEIHPNRKFLLQQAKLPPKHHFSTGETPSKIRSSDVNSNVEPGSKRHSTESDSSKERQGETPSKIQSSDDNSSVEPGSKRQYTESDSSKERQGETPSKIRSSDVNSSVEPGSKRQYTESDSSKERQDTQLSTARPKECCKPELQDEWKEENRSLRRKIRKLEERVTALEKNLKRAAEETDDPDKKLNLVDHVKGDDVQRVMNVLARALFTEEELLMSSRTGKRSSKCEGRDPRPPLDQRKLADLERLVMKKTNIDRPLFKKKLENLQKVLRQKQKK